MTGLATLTALLLTSAPLQVRVMEREKPVRAKLEAKTLRCDGKPLPGNSVDVEGFDRRLKAGTALCDEIDAKGAVRVTVGELRRGYAGRIVLAWEGTVLRLLNEVEVEAYLPGVLGSEAAQLPAAAQRAQAVVSRTFALASRGRHQLQGYDLCDLAHCQVYHGQADETAATQDAVAKTKDRVLLVGGVGLKPAFFHAACGGGTSRAEDVFGDDGAGAAVSDVGKNGPTCQGAPHFTWSLEVDRAQLAQALGVKADGIAFEPLKRDRFGRVVEVRAFGQRFTGTDFQSRLGRMFGYHVFQSMKVTAAEVEGVVRFEGTGLGHGVGLCQYGAKAMAEAGADDAAILKKYFPDCRVALAP
ncbi:MAG: SpoIID/LytB domain-containing protein [Myxococcaceae bacterium]|nr:SpoIID/LytB domain-containing protein [Myxococcaceae bacterium]